MKNIKWKIILLTSIVCLLPILLGILMWNQLPEKIPTHFNFNNEPDAYSSKTFGVFGLPVIMMILQIFLCIVNDLNFKNHTLNINFERITKWIIPVMSVILQTVILGYSIGLQVDIRIVCALIIGVLFVVLGYHIPKLDYIKNYKISPEKAKKINKAMGKMMVIMGVLILITIFLPPISTVIWLILLIPCTIISIIYGFKYSK